MLTYFLANVGKPCEFFTIKFREMTGQKYAICLSISSSCTDLCTTLRLAAEGTSLPSTTTPMVGVVVDLRTHVTCSPRNGAKLASRERTYTMFCFQQWRVTDSLLVRSHCLGARQVAAMISSCVQRYDIRIMLWPKHS